MNERAALQSGVLLALASAAAWATLWRWVDHSGKNTEYAEFEYAGP